MTILELYKKHIKGEVSKEKFLYEARRDSNLPWILNTTSYIDAVKILKNKGILKEDAIPGGVGANTSAADVDPSELELGIEIEMEHTNDPEVAKEIALDHLAEDPQYYSKFKASGIENETDDDWTWTMIHPVDEDTVKEDHNPELFSIILRYVEDPDEAEQYEDSDPDTWPDWLVANLERDEDYQKLKSGSEPSGIEGQSNVDLSDPSQLSKYMGNLGSSDKMFWESDDDDPEAMHVEKIESNPEMHEGLLDKVFNKKKVSKDDSVKRIIDRIFNDPELLDLIASDPEFQERLKFIRSKKATKSISEDDITVSDTFSDHEQQKIKSQIPDVEIQQDQDEDHYYTNVSSKSKSADEIRSIIDKIINASSFSKKLNESKTNSGFTYVKEPLLRSAIDYVDPYQLLRGVQVELYKKGDYSSDSLSKCLVKVVKNLSKDPYFYKDLQIANYKEVKAKDKELEMKPVKKAKEAKKTSPDGHLKKALKPKEKASTSNTKKENKKGIPDGVTLMKENVLNELRKVEVKKKDLNEDYHHKYGKGQRVNTPDGFGIITGIFGGTVSVDLESGEQADYQFNVLDKQARDDHFGKMPNLSAQQDKVKDLAKESKKDQIVKRLKEYISKKKTNEAKKFKAGGETVFKSDQEANEFEKDLKKARVPFTKSNV